MSNIIGITGSRALDQVQTKLALSDLMKLCDIAKIAYVGDADGVDRLARFVYRNRSGASFQEFRTEGFKPWQLQQRSKRMVDALARDNGMLHAFLNKPCPAGVTVNSWAGSGTWGTVRYAIAKGVPVELHWLIEPCELPDWMGDRQMSLL